MIFPAQEQCNSLPLRNEAIQLINKFTFPARTTQLRMKLLELTIFQLPDFQTATEKAWQTGTALLRTSTLSLSLSNSLSNSTGIFFYCQPARSPPWLRN